MVGRWTVATIATSVSDPVHATLDETWLCNGHRVDSVRDQSRDGCAC